LKLATAEGALSTGSTVEVDALAKSFGSRRILDNVTFAAKGGEILGLLGPNGAGKTTTLSILATLMNADAGTVRIEGFDARWQREQIRPKLGLVPQSIALYPSLSALRNLELFARIHGLRGRQARMAAMAALSEVGLSDHAGQRTSILSGGMKRRLNLACGIVHNPRVLLLDEPTVGVDPQSRERVLQTIRALADAGTTAIYSTHYMEEVEALCDRVVLIDRGRVVADGTVPEIIALAGRRPRIEITFQSPLSTPWYEGVSGTSELKPQSHEARTVLQFESLAQVSELLERARAAGGTILEFNVHSPNLSDAFMTLTGHALRDDEN
jgi:ABC-2 type transport system ATP-binding protein